MTKYWVQQFSVVGLLVLFSKQEIKGFVRVYTIRNLIEFFKLCLEMAKPKIDLFLFEFMASTRSKQRLGELFFLCYSPFWLAICLGIVGLVMCISKQQQHFLFFIFLEQKQESNRKREKFKPVYNCLDTPTIMQTFWLEPIAFMGGLSLEIHKKIIWLCSLHHEIYSQLLGVWCSGQSQMFQKLQLAGFIKFPL